tara:strand:+ start:252 stop:746 length:495 start_codon:yes stop_codon:yes gene_type:complete
MINGLHRVSLLLYLVLIFFLKSSIYADNIQLSPLINLDQIEPSYEFLGDELIDEELNEPLPDDKMLLKHKELNIAYISILNKITANVDNLEIELKNNYQYGELRIYPIDCYLSNPEQKPETAVYMNIYHDTKNKKLFSGWMLKSLPSISAIEHPIYDIWINDCY